MIFELNDIVSINGGHYAGSIAKVIGRRNPCDEETESYLVEILPRKGAYYHENYGVWVEVLTKYMELLEPGERERRA